jgi:hypothetical protein
MAHTPQHFLEAFPSWEASSTATHPRNAALSGLPSGAWLQVDTQRCPMLVGVLDDRQCGTFSDRVHNALINPFALPPSARSAPCSTWIGY